MTERTAPPEKPANNDPTIPDIVGIIKQKHIVPRPRWMSLATNLAFWIILISSLILGSLALSIIVANIVDLGPDILRIFGIRHIPFLFFATIPILWGSLFALALAFGILAFHQTRHGYRYGILFTGSVLLILLVSASIGSHLARWDGALERNVERTFPERPHRFFAPREVRWSDPGRGVLVGKVLEQNKDILSIETKEGSVWGVLLTDQTRVARHSCLLTGEIIVIMGKALPEKHFEAFFVRSFPSDQEEGGASRCKPSPSDDVSLNVQARRLVPNILEERCIHS